MVTDVSVSVNSNRGRARVTEGMVRSQVGTNRGVRRGYRGDRENPLEREREREIVAIREGDSRRGQQADFNRTKWRWGHIQYSTSLAVTSEIPRRGGIVWRGSQLGGGR